MCEHYKPVSAYYYFNPGSRTESYDGQQTIVVTDGPRAVTALVYPTGHHPGEKIWSGLSPCEPRPVFVQPGGQQSASMASENIFWTNRPGLYKLYAAGAQVHSVAQLGGGVNMAVIGTYAGVIPVIVVVAMS